MEDPSRSQMTTQYGV